MLRLLINFVILMLVLRMLRPVFVSAGKVLQRVFAPGAGGGGDSGTPKVKYPDLSPYEIEDAEFEEVPEERE